jgi:hypothetical protein
VLSREAADFLLARLTFQTAQWGKPGA